MDLKGSSKTLAAIGILSALYFVAGKFGLSLAFVHVSISAVWPPTGIAIAALLILGYRVWPGIFLGAFLVNLTTAGTIATSLGIATGNTLEALLGAYLVFRFAHGRESFHRTRDIFKFTFLAAMVATAIAATFGVTSLILGSIAHFVDFNSMWWTWWQGDAVGAIVVAPLILLWSERPWFPWSWSQVAEAIALLGLLELVGMSIFGGLLPIPLRGLPLEYLCIPLLIWAAVRFGPREAAASVAVLSAIAIYGTLHSYGPFVRISRNQSLLLLQAFMAVMSIMTLVLAAEVAERKRSMENARQMAHSDSLTGLANYRCLLDVLESECRRSARTKRSFAILLLDLDGLKKINDQHGHGVGSRALQRLAFVLRLNCRDVDTAARYGGDEFAVVLPEADSETAEHVARRITSLLANDKKEPRISASVGVASFPHDGTSPSELLDAADRALYSKKNSRPKVHSA